MVARPSRCDHGHASGEVQGPWANVLPAERRLKVLAALVNGPSIRATERMTGVHRDMICRFLQASGEGCARLHDRMARDLTCPLVDLAPAPLAVAPAPAPGDLFLWPMLPVMPAMHPGHLVPGFLGDGIHPERGDLAHDPASVAATPSGGPRGPHTPSPPDDDVIVSG
jgi:hypothetical protein